jgi:hypothetical protein
MPLSFRQETMLWAFHCAYIPIHLDFGRLMLFHTTCCDSSFTKLSATRVWLCSAAALLATHSKTGVELLVWTHNTYDLTILHGV